MNKFKIGDEVRCVKVKAGAEDWLTGNGIYKIVPFTCNSQEDFVIGDTGGYVNTFWGEFIKENTIFEIGEKVYFICSWSEEKTYGIVRHVGKLPSTLSHHPFIKEVGKDRCIWSEWDKEWDGKINSTSLGWMPKERVHKICKEDKMFQIGERITENNKDELISGDIIREDESQVGGNWFVFEREKNPSWFYSWQIFKVTTIKGAVGIFFRRNEKLVNRFFGSHSYHDAGILSQDYNNHKSYYMGNVYDYQQKKVTISRYQELKEKIKNLQVGWDKEADDFVNELANHFDCFVAIKVYHDGGKDEKHKGAISIELGNRTLADPRFHFYSQCEKLEAFKQALLWLLDHSDIKKDEKEEKIKGLELKVECMREQYERDLTILQTRIKNLRDGLGD